MSRSQTLPVHHAAQLRCERIELRLELCAIEARGRPHHERKLAFDELGLLSDDSAARCSDERAVCASRLVHPLFTDAGHPDDAGDLLLQMKIRSQPITAAGSATM